MLTPATRLPCRVMLYGRSVHICRSNDMNELPSFRFEPSTTGTRATLPCCSSAIGSPSSSTPSMTGAHCDESHVLAHGSFELVLLLVAALPTRLHLTRERCGTCRPHVIRTQCLALS